ncbi:MAG: DUF4215 domain-containing protein [Deltaproteobacteria bacterium]|nr:DUF4215 domain-containing protein [Deltaproteobacteria bacterium]
MQQLSIKNHKGLSLGFIKKTLILLMMFLTLGGCTVIDKINDFISDTRADAKEKAEDIFQKIKDKIEDKIEDKSGQPVEQAIEQTIEQAVEQPNAIPEDVLGVVQENFDAGLAEVTGFVEEKKEEIDSMLEEGDIVDIKKILDDISVLGPVDLSLDKINNLKKIIGEINASDLSKELFEKISDLQNMVIENSIKKILSEVHQKIEELREYLIQNNNAEDINGILCEIDLIDDVFTQMDDINVDTEIVQELDTIKNKIIGAQGVDGLREAIDGSLDALERLKTQILKQRDTQFEKIILDYLPQARDFVVNLEDEGLSDVMVQRLEQLEGKMTKMDNKEISDKTREIIEQLQDESESALGSDAVSTLRDSLAKISDAHKVVGAVNQVSEIIDDLLTGSGDCFRAGCGDKTVDTGESCDDGNITDGDGCTANCELEFCGDGIVNNGNEECDDHNRINDDFCTNECKKATCGDSITNSVSGETCDDGNHVNGDGCSLNCRTEVCGDGVVNNKGTEECDDGNLASGDGCSPSCSRESRTYNCPSKPDFGTAWNSVPSYTQNCLAVVDGVCVTWDPVSDTETDYDTTGSTTSCRYACAQGFVRNGSVCSYCGNGTLEAGEQCDDGNVKNGDGCQSSCAWETKKYQCIDKPALGTIWNTVSSYWQSCTASDGNACLAWNPVADPMTDYNTVESSTSCQYTCAKGFIWNGTHCSRCGDGTLNIGEQCDDGNVKDGDGCSSSCSWESRVYDCPAKPATGTLWNTVKSYTQKCRAVSGGVCISWAPATDPTTEYRTAGSTMSCQYKCATGYSWNGTRCARCGDGAVDIGEQCDDGNTKNGDGCTSSCKWESRTYSCSPKPATGTLWNSVKSYTQKCRAVSGGVCTSWAPATDPTTEYRTAGSTMSCQYKCATGYSWNGTICIKPKRTIYNIR